MKLVKLSNLQRSTQHSPIVYVNPMRVRTIVRYDDRTRIYFDSNNYQDVTESLEEVVRRVDAHLSEDRAT